MPTRQPGQGATSAANPVPRSGTIPPGACDMGALAGQRIRATSTRKFPETALKFRAARGGSSPLSTPGIASRERRRLGGARQRWGGLHHGEDPAPDRRRALFAVRKGLSDLSW